MPTSGSARDHSAVTCKGSIAGLRSRLDFDLAPAPAPELDFRRHCAPAPAPELDFQKRSAPAPAPELFPSIERLQLLLRSLEKKFKCSGSSSGALYRRSKGSGSCSGAVLRNESRSSSSSRAVLRNESCSGSGL